jgi:hypothetical protein
MKPRHLQRTHLGLAALAAAMVLAAPAAHAFTYETKNYTDDSTLPPGYTDPDKKVEQFNSGDVTAKPGGTTFHFEVKPSNNGFDRNGRFAPAWGPQPFPDGR